MQVKKGVISEGVAPQIWYALGVADNVYRAAGYTLVVTSLKDGKHSAQSLHYRGLAADLRTRTIKTGDELRNIYARLKNILDFFGYDVVLEDDHIHVEYDFKKGDHFWLLEVD